MTEDIDLKTQYPHAMLPEASADEFARQEFVKSLKFHLASQISPGNKDAFEARAKPRFERSAKRPPETIHDVRKVMADEPYFNFWSALQRNSQEMMWKSVQLSVERQLPDLIDASKSDLPETGGTLRLDPALETPRYHKAVDIHCMPGGYHSEFTTDDVANGATYDRAVYLYAMGRMGPFNSDIGDTTIAWIKANHPNFRPRRILDMSATRPCLIATPFRMPKSTVSMSARRCSAMPTPARGPSARPCISASRTPRRPTSPTAIST